MIDIKIDPTPKFSQQVEIEQENDRVNALSVPLFDNSETGAVKNPLFYYYYACQIKEYQQIELDLTNFEIQSPEIFFKFKSYEAILNKCIADNHTNSEFSSSYQAIQAFVMEIQEAQDLKTGIKILEKAQIEFRNLFMESLVKDINKAGGETKLIDQSTLEIVEGSSTYKCRINHSGFITEAELNGVKYTGLLLNAEQFMESTTDMIINNSVLKKRFGLENIKEVSCLKYNSAYQGLVSINNSEELFFANIDFIIKVNEDQSFLTRVEEYNKNLYYLRTLREISETQGQHPQAKPTQDNIDRESAIKVNQNIPDYITKLSQIIEACKQVNIINLEAEEQVLGNFLPESVKDDLSNKQVDRIKLFLNPEGSGYGLVFTDQQNRILQLISDSNGRESISEKDLLNSESLFFIKVNLEALYNVNPDFISELQESLEYYANNNSKINDVLYKELLDLARKHHLLVNNNQTLETYENILKIVISHKIESNNSKFMGAYKDHLDDALKMICKNYSSDSENYCKALILLLGADPSFSNPTAIKTIEEWASNSNSDYQLDASIQLLLRNRMEYSNNLLLLGSKEHSFQHEDIIRIIKNLKNEDSSMLITELLTKKESAYYGLCAAMICDDKNNHKLAHQKFFDIISNTEEIGLLKYILQTEAVYKYLKHNLDVTKILIYAANLEQFSLNKALEIKSPISETFDYSEPRYHMPIENELSNLRKLSGEIEVLKIARAELSIAKIEGNKLKIEALTRYITTRELNIDFPNRFTAEQLSKILAVRIGGIDHSKPSLIIYSNKSDANGAYYVIDHQGFFENDYNVILYEIGSYHEFIESRKEAAKLSKTGGDVILYELHGEPKSFLLLEDYRRKYQVAISYEQLIALSKSVKVQDLKKDGFVALISCSTGKGRSQNDNMGNAMRILYKHARDKGILSPTTSTNVDKFKFRDGLFFDLDYSVGKDLDRDNKYQSSNLRIREKLTS